MRKVISNVRYAHRYFKIIELDKGYEARVSGLGIQQRRKVSSFDKAIVAFAEWMAVSSIPGKKAADLILRLNKKEKVA